MKEEDYKLKYIGDDWVFLPKEEVQKKFDYDRLLYNIRRREKKIESELLKIKELKDGLRKLKSQRTQEYKQLIKYHKKFSPSLTYSMSKNQKKKKEDNMSGMFVTSGNRSWGCDIRIGDLRKSIYLGTNQSVTELLDKIEGSSKKWSGLNPFSRIEEYDLIRNRLDELISPFIKKEMIRELKREETLLNWYDRKLDGKKYLNKLYKDSPYYEPPVVEEKKESKGFFLGIVNGKPIYGKKNKKNPESK